jgi:hypothetical protein
VRALGGPALAALVAALAALPALGIPFLADDWVDLAAAEKGQILVTPFGYVRPLSMLTHSLELRLFGGPSPTCSHLTNLVLLAAAAALVVLAVRRYLEDPPLALTAGLLFALHPYHVENAAWVAARPDVLYSVLSLGAILSYDRWRDGRRGIPVGALVLLEMALLAKESALTVPALLVAIGFLDAKRRPARAEWRQGYTPLIALVLIHFLGLRLLALGGLGLRGLGGSVTPWLKNLLVFGTATLLPVHTEFLEGRPRAWGSLAILLGGALLLAARRGCGRIPPRVWGLVVVFVILVGPGIISFQGRYFFLAGAASSAALALLIRSAGGRMRTAILLILIPAWSLSAAQHWAGWLDASRVSRRLIGGLVEASRRPGVEELVVANMPHRVHGSPVAADFGTAVVLSGGRPVIVRAATALDYPDPGAETVDGSPALSPRRDGEAAEVRLRVPGVRFSRVVLPRAPAGSAEVVRAWATVIFDGAERLRVSIPRALSGTRAAYVWEAAGLRRLF